MYEVGDTAMCRHCRETVLAQAHKSLPSGLLWMSSEDDSDGEPMLISICEARTPLYSSMISSHEPIMHPDELPPSLTDLSRLEDWLSS